MVAPSEPQHGGSRGPQTRLSTRYTSRPSIKNNVFVAWSRWRNVAGIALMQAPEPRPPRKSPGGAVHGRGRFLTDRVTEGAGFCGAPWGPGRVTEGAGFWTSRETRQRGGGPGEGCHGRGRFLRAETIPFRDVLRAPAQQISIGGPPRGVARPAVVEGGLRRPHQCILRFPRGGGRGSGAGAAGVQASAIGAGHRKGMQERPQSVLIGPQLMMY